MLRFAVISAVMSSMGIAVIALHRTYRWGYADAESDLLEGEEALGRMGIAEFAIVVIAAPVSMAYDLLKGCVLTVKARRS
jgi:hypothetical protein